MAEHESPLSNIGGSVEDEHLEETALLNRMAEHESPLSNIGGSVEDEHLEETALLNRMAEHESPLSNIGGSVEDEHLEETALLNRMAEHESPLSNIGGSVEDEHLEETALLNRMAEHESPLSNIGGSVEDEHLEETALLNRMAEHESPLSNIGGSVEDEHLEETALLNRMAEHESPLSNIGGSVEDEHLEETALLNRMAEHESPLSNIGGSVEDEHLEETGESRESQSLASPSMKNPGVLAALQDKLSTNVVVPADYHGNLPKEVKRRVKALKKLQNEVVNFEAEFYQEVKAMELRYVPSYTQLFEKRRDILVGKKEPTDEECDWLSDGDDKNEIHKLTEDLKKKVSVKAGGDATEQAEVSGIPNFWLTVFKNVNTLSDMVKVHDEPILVHLQDIKAVVHSEEPPGFTLEFHFEANEYFTNSILTKSYEMCYKPDPLDPLMYEGPEIVKSVGCTIHWKDGKNVTVTQIKKKHKRRFRGDTRTITKQVQVDSFFNFFNPPAVPEGESDSETDEETETLRQADFDVGHFIRDKIVPKAVLYFTGEAVDCTNYQKENEIAGKPMECELQ